ncbi:MAG TPA: hypothetical protein VGM62_04770 [Chthoniobacterales bacterium]|jgi:hypothetical protein
MRDARTASLIRRWLSGKKLTDEEKIEVSQRAGISLDILIAGPSSPGAKEAVQRAKDTRKHAKYPKKIPEYAAFFGKDERTIKRMIRRGKETGELPPLDDPPKMAAWWRRNMDHDVPDYLLGFADPNAQSGDGHRQSGSDPAATGDKGPRDYSNVKSLDIAANVEALRQTHAVNKHRLDEAMLSPDANEQTIMLCQRNFERSFELVRKGEIALIEIQKQRGDLIDRESVKTELAQLLESLRLMRETMPRRVMIALEQILPRRFQRVCRALEKFLAPAIEKARADEETIFRNLGAIEGPESVEKALAA